MKISGNMNVDGKKNRYLGYDYCISTRLLHSGRHYIRRRQLKREKKSSFLTSSMALFMLAASLLLPQAGQESLLPYLKHGSLHAGIQLVASTGQTGENTSPTSSMALFMLAASLLLPLARQERIQVFLHAGGHLVASTGQTGEYPPLPQAWLSSCWRPACCFHWQDRIEPLPPDRSLAHGPSPSRSPAHFLIIYFIRFYSCLFVVINKWFSFVLNILQSPSRMVITTLCRRVKTDN